MNKIHVCYYIYIYICICLPINLSIYQSVGLSIYQW